MESIIVGALVVVFALGLIVGTRSQPSCASHQYPSEELIQVLLLVLDYKAKKKKGKK